MKKIPDFDAKERVVIKMVTANIKREIVATTLGTSVRVVDNILGAIYTKIGCRGIIPLVHFSIQNGFVKVGDFKK